MAFKTGMYALLHIFFKDPKRLYPMAEGDGSDVVGETEG
jgi:hypothetical protein